MTGMGAPRQAVKALAVFSVTGELSLILSTTHTGLTFVRKQEASAQCTVLGFRTREHVVEGSDMAKAPTGASQVVSAQHRSLMQESRATHGGCLGSDPDSPKVRQTEHAPD